MYKYGVARCCCEQGGCDILNRNNDYTEVLFTGHYDPATTSAEPSFTLEDGVYVPSFSGTSNYTTIYPNTRYSSDNVGMMINPVGYVTSMTYTYTFGSTGENYKVVSLHFYMVEYDSSLTGDDKYRETEKNKSINQSWDRLCVTIDGQEVFSSVQFCDYSTEYTGKIFIIRKKADSNLSIANDTIQIYAERSDNKDSLIYEQDYTTETSFTTQWAIVGSSYTLDVTNGYSHVWKPDQWWLFPENLAVSMIPSGFPTNYEPGTTVLEKPANYDDLSTAERMKWNYVINGDKERTGCEYPDPDCLIFGDFAKILPKLKLTFNFASTDSLYIWNGYDVFGWWRQDCIIHFNDSRYMGAREIVACTPGDTGCLCDNPSPRGLKFMDIALTATDNATNSTKIDIDLYLYIQSDRDNTDSYSMHFTGQADKDRNGKIDITTLSNISLLPASNGLNDELANCTMSVSTSNHTETHNPVYYAYNTTSDELQSITIDYKLGILGYNSTVPRPVSTLDFQPYFDLFTFVLEPVIDRENCMDRVEIFRSPGVSNTGEYTNVYLEFDLLTGEITVKQDGNYSPPDFQSIPNSVPGTAVVSPRDNGTLYYTEHSPIEAVRTSTHNTQWEWYSMSAIQAPKYVGYFWNPDEQTCYGDIVHWWSRGADSKTITGNSELIAVCSMDVSDYNIAKLSADGTVTYYGGKKCILGAIKFNNE